MTEDPECRLEWGWRGAREAAERGDLLVVVDVLSFSTAAATAVHFGGMIYPCSPKDDLPALARQTGAEVAVGRAETPAKGRFSLSPLTFIGVAPGTKVALPSPNGAACCRYGEKAPTLLVGSLVNARAVAVSVSTILESTGGQATILACGERWQQPSEDGSLRMAVEDYLGAGAILSYLDCSKTAEARICEGAFLHLRESLAEIIWECDSGKELRDREYGSDVEHAARLNLYESVPVLRGGWLEAWQL